MCMCAYQWVMSTHSPVQALLTHYNNAHAHLRVIVLIHLLVCMRAACLCVRACLSFFSMSSYSLLLKSKWLNRNPSISKAEGIMNWPVGKHKAEL